MSLRRWKLPTCILSNFFLRRYLKNLEFYTVSREICVTVLLNAFLLFLKRHYRRAQIWTRCFLVYEWRNNLLHIVFQKHFDKTSLQNLLAVALHKPSTMSSSFLSDYHKASNAVDGVTVCPTGFTLAHTLEEYRPWIKIDLQATFEVNSVVIYNRENCCGKFMHILISTIFLIFFARWQTQPVYIYIRVLLKNIFQNIKCTSLESRFFFGFLLDKIITNINTRHDIISHNFLYHVLDLLIDWLIGKSFTPYRQYFSHVTADHA